LGNDASVDDDQTATLRCETTWGFASLLQHAAAIWQATRDTSAV